MDGSTAHKLLDLNRQFYQTFAPQFSATRQRLQPGVKRILETIEGQAQVLDLGCGNGALAKSLAGNGHQGGYVGLDFSPELLAEAQAKLQVNPRFSFTRGDLVAPDWEAGLPTAGFDVLLAFAVLHHLPGHDLRRQVLVKARRLLATQGSLIHSEWQFLHSSRLRARIQPWERIGLHQTDVDPGDYLLDWRHGGQGYRYVHHFSVEELAILAGENGFSVAETFYSDGDNSKLGLYQIWKLV